MRQNISQPLTYIYSGRGDLSERVKKAAEYIDETTLDLIRLQSGLWSFFLHFFSISKVVTLRRELRPVMPTRMHDVCTL